VSKDSFQLAHCYSFAIGFVIIIIIIIDYY
jgi:hypothetical protein